MKTRHQFTFTLSSIIILCCCASVKHSGTHDGSSKCPTEPPVTSMITATTGGEAIDGGLQILKKGGNAIDAALSTSLSQVALAGGSWVSYAGMMNMVYYDAKTGKVY